MRERKILKPAKPGSIPVKDVKAAVAKVMSLRKPITYPKTAELVDRLHSVLTEYDGEIGYAEALGAIRLLELRVIDTQNENICD